MDRRSVIVVSAAAAIVTIGMGIRQTFGVFLAPMSHDLGLGREAFALAIGIQNLFFGLGQPFAGALADRYGAARVVVAGALLYAAGLAATTMAAGVVGLSLSLGVAVGLAQSAATLVIVMGAVTRTVPEDQRSLAFGIVTSAGSFGMFVMAPGAQALLDVLGWHGGFIALALVALGTVVLARGVAATPYGRAARAEASVAGVGAVQGAWAALRATAATRDFWLLNAGFFVCGFHVTFVATHLPAVMADAGLPAMAGAWALALVGFFNIIGSYTSGWLGGRVRKRAILAAIYGGRAVVIAVFLALPVTLVSALAFAAAIGLLWLSTVAPTGGLVAQKYGATHFSMLYGLVFLAHQVGAFLGVWLGGRAYDVTGSYDLVWWISIGLGILAALLNLPIREAAPMRATAPAASAG